MDSNLEIGLYGERVVGILFVRQKGLTLYFLNKIENKFSNLWCISNFVYWVPFYNDLRWCSSCSSPELDGSLKRVAKLGPNTRKPLHMVPCHLWWPKPRHPCVRLPQSIVFWAMGFLSSLNQDKNKILLLQPPFFLGSKILLAQVHLQVSPQFSMFME